MKKKASSNYKWEFAPRFRRGAFGWRSQLPIQRIKEALKEIRQVMRADPILAAEGAILLLEKVSGALAHVDSSSGAMGAGLASLYWMAQGYGYEITNIDVRDSFRALEQAWQNAQHDRNSLIEKINEIINDKLPDSAFVRKALMPYLQN